MAVVGAGFVAGFHLEILGALSGVEVVCVCDPQAARAQELARRFGVPRAVGDVADLADLSVDVAHVLVPPDRHAEVARDLLERGIHVLLEKPMALACSEARGLADLARERRLVLGVNHNALHHPAFVRMLARIRAGEIGRIEHVQVTLSVPLRQLDAGDFSHWMFRDPRNIVFEQAAHPFSQLVELVGGVEEMTSVTLRTRELEPGRVFHDRWCLAAVAEGGTAELYLAFGEPFTRSTIQVLGSDGFLEADLHHDLLAGERMTPWLDFWNAFLAGRRRGGELRGDARRGLVRYLAHTLGLRPREDAFFAGMRASIQDFHGALGRGEPPRSDGVLGERVIAWCEAAVGTLPGAASEPPLPEESPPPREGEIVVTGASGFIGRPTLDALLARGAPVTAVVRRRHGLPAVIADGAREGRVRLAMASLEDPAAMAAAIEGARVVIHLATGGGDTWEAVERAMVRGTAALGEACVEAGVERLIHVSSIAALYLGPDCGRGVIGDDVATDGRPGARPPYARGKIAAEAELLRLHRERGLAVTIVRPGVVVGPRAPLQHSGLGLWVRDNHCVGWGMGERPVPLVLVDDVAEALVLLALRRESDLDGRALNLAARVPLRPREVIEAHRRATGRDLHFHPRPLLASQAMEIGKWIVKRIGGRRDAPFPSWRDLKSRALWPELGCERAREMLGWRPVEDRETFLARLLPR